MRIKILLLILLVIGIGIVAFLSYITPIKEHPTEIVTRETPRAELFFITDFVFPASGSATTEIMISSNTPVASAQIDLVFNPEIIYNVNITPSENNFFGNKNSYEVALLEVRENIGRITFAIKLLPTVSEKKGEGPIAKITFQTNAFILNQTEINFLDKSTVMTRSSRESILTNTKPLTVFFRNMNTPTTQLNVTPRPPGN